MWLFKLDYACDSSPYINLDAWVLRQRLLDTGSPAAKLDSGLDINSWANIGTSANAWDAAATIQAATPVGKLRAVNGLPAIASMHAALASRKTIQWAPVGSTGATFCVVAKLPPTAANSNQVLFEFQPAFAMAREGAAGDMAFTVGTTKGIVKAAFDNKWHSYAAVVSGRQTVLYVDGVQKGAINHAGATPANTRPLPTYSGRRQRQQRRCWLVMCAK